MPHTEHECRGCSSLSTFSKSGKSHYAPDTKIEPKRIDISLQFNKWPKRHVSAKIIQTLHVNQSSKSIQFNGISFQNVVVTDLDGKCDYRYDGELITVWWDTELTVGTTKNILIEYQVENPIDGLHFTVENKLDQEYAITDHETERARYWLACVDYPTIRTTLDFHITVPDHLQVYANGEFKSEDVAQGFKTSHWSLDHICPSYLICFGVGKFDIIHDESVGETKVAYVAPLGSDMNLMKMSFDQTPKIISWLQKKTGVTFPFKKYFIFLAPIHGSAMENISLVTFGFEFLLDETLKGEMKWNNDRVNLHECAHSYFGDSLVIRHFEHAWLKESWAKYMEICWFTDAYSKEEGDYQLHLQMRNYQKEVDESYARPIVCRQYDTSWNLFDRHTYPGGSWRLHMLHKLLGPDLFWKGVSNYVTKYTKKLVETEDFKKCLEEVSNVNLTKFFDQWIYGRGYPILKGDCKFVPGEAVELRFTQTQMDVKREIGFFEFDLEVEITLVENDVKKVVKKIAKFSQDVQIATVVVPTSVKPHMIRVDPDQKILFKLNMNPGEDLLLNTMKEAGDIFNRMWAASELVKTGNRATMKKILKIIEVEPYFGVRGYVASLFASPTVQRSGKTLEWFLANEKHPRALVNVVNACNFKNKHVKSGLIQFLQRKDLGYHAHANALMYLAQQEFDPTEADVAMQTILSHIDGDVTKRFDNIIKNGGYRALGKLTYWTPKPYEYLKKKLAEEIGESKRVLLIAYADSARNLDEKVQKEAISVLISNLMDPWDKIRLAAVSGLGLLKASGEIGTAEKIKKTIAFQFHPDFESMVARLRKDVSGDVKALEKKLEEMKKQMDQMQVLFSKAIEKNK